MHEIGNFEHAGMTVKREDNERHDMACRGIETR
jgi:hypothetical protein